MKKANITMLTRIALLIAVEMVLSRFCSIATPIVKIGFGFIPISMIAMLYGPFYACTAAALADFIGAVLIPIGAYFPGFTLTAGLTGMIYGLFLYRKPKSWVRIVCAVLMVSLGLQLGLDTLWLRFITGNGYLALLPTRILKCVMMTPLQVILIRFAWSRLCPLVDHPSSSFLKQV